MTVNSNIKKSVTNKIFIFWLPRKIYHVTNTIYRSRERISAFSLDIHHSRVSQTLPLFSSFSPINPNMQKQCCFSCAGFVWLSACLLLRFPLSGLPAFLHRRCRRVLFWVQRSSFPSPLVVHIAVMAVPLSYFFPRVSFWCCRFGFLLAGSSTSPLFF